MQSSNLVRAIDDAKAFGFAAAQVRTTTPAAAKQQRHG
jgi:hypothetical protein